MKLYEFRQSLQGGQYDANFTELYGEAQPAAKKRYDDITNAFAEAFGEERDVAILSTPGRTEIGGNHTDHNAGYVLAAAVGLDIISVVSKNSDGMVRLKSVGFAPINMSLADLSPKESERNHSIALMRGVAARMRELGYTLGGFDCMMSSTVPGGSGLSSSAAFEVQIGSAFSHLYNEGRLPDVQNAQIAQYAENHYFGKPCGLMDQTACAVGGLIQIDFRDSNKPIIEQVAFDFASAKHVLYIVNTRGSHADLTPDYAAIEGEMKSAAKFLGQPLLRFASKEALLDNLKALREEGNDRAALRAYHYFNDNARVLLETEALKDGDFERFKRLVIESGRSSFMYLQNVYSTARPKEQGLPVALMLAEEILAGKGAWRVHGGGFAGTIQTFVPDALAGEFEARMDAVFGEDAVYRTMIRPKGTICIDK